MFSSLVEGIESTARLVARHVIIEKLYLHNESEAALCLQEAIRNLYATVLIYLARVKMYFTGGTLSKCSTAFHQWRSSLLYIKVFTHMPSRASRSGVSRNDAKRVRRIIEQGFRD